MIENNDESNDSHSFIIPSWDTKLKNRKIPVASSVNNEINSSVVANLKQSGVTPLELSLDTLVGYGSNVNAAKMLSSSNLNE